MRTLILAAALSSTLVAVPGFAAPPSEGTILETARSTGTFQTLVSALEVAGLDQVLAGEGPFTVFAPTDNAFARLPAGTVETLLRPENRDRLKQILTSHVLPTPVTAAEGLALGRVETLSGFGLELRLEGGQLRVNDAAVELNDLQTANGVIHAIDSVLIPPEREPVLPDPRAGIVAVLSLAIERGVPLYNAGQSVACVSVYEIAVRALLEGPGEIPVAFRTPLEESLREAAQCTDAPSAAWALREGMDRTLQLIALDLELQSSRSKEPRMTSTSTRRLFSFDNASEIGNWFSLNDDVMGGISRSRLESAGEGIARFVGALSLENNGGFATVRSREHDLQLGRTDGLRFRVRGDGRTYRVSALSGDQRFQMRNWQKEFTTRPGEWQEITVRYDELVLNIRGRRFPDEGPVDPATIRSLSFGIADKNETPFSLEIDWVDAFGPASVLSARPAADGQ